MTPDAPTFYVLLTAALRDCFDASVILLLLTGLFLLIPLRIVSGLAPLLLSAVISSMLVFAFPSFVLTGGWLLFHIIWVPALALLTWNAVQSRRKKRRIQENRIVSNFARGITLIGFHVLLIPLVRSGVSGNTIDWPYIHASSVLLVTFYYLYEIAPWRWFRFQSAREIARVTLYLSIGLFFLRGGMWSYGLFQASIKERPGSFPLKGVVYSEQLAQGWRFPHLHAMIQNHWYYPESPSQQPVPIMRDKSLLYGGLQKAETFRLELLKSEYRNPPRAELIAKAIVEFQQQAEPHLQNHYSLKNYQLDTEYLIEWMKGSSGEIGSHGIFGQFTGKWYGIWDTFNTDHHWRPLEYFEPAIKVPGPNPFNLRVSQYCWVGDGFGWNVITSRAPKSNLLENQEVILGIVYHVKNQDTSNILLTRPHIGLPVGYGQLIWITAGEVFLEEIIPNMRKAQEQYIITGFKYSIENSILINTEKAFQAVYSRNPKYRKPFYTFDIELHAAAQSP